MIIRDFMSRVGRPMIVSGVVLLALGLGAGAGSLTPSALPAATMHSLANIYDSIASAAFDSSAIVANQNGSLLGNLKYIENQIVWASGSPNIWSLNSGNVGIGATVPEEKLEVGGNILASASAASVGLILNNLAENDAKFTIQSTGTAGSIARLDFLGSASQTFMSIASSGNIGIGTTVPTAKLAIAGTASISNTLWVSPSGNSGNVGIGTTTPVQKLDVSGSVNISKGSYYRYNDAIFAMASTSLNNYFIGGAGNLTMTGVHNTANGFQAFYSNTTGLDSIANGYRALYSNTTGYDNTANGANAMFYNTTGYSNTANGSYALRSNTDGSWNTANGSYTLFYNTTGFANTANGFQVLFYNTTGYSNTANGYQALYNNTDGYNNGANGYRALHSNTTGYSNTANSFQALYFNTTGYSNTANGVWALYRNTTGTQNTADGYQTLYNNTTGYNNTANGVNALFSNTTGTQNTADGYQTLYTGINFSNTAALGYQAGYYASASNNIFLGANADVVGANKSGLITNSIAIGSSAKTASSRQLVVGADNGTNYLTEAYFGSGVSASAPFAFRINSSGGSGTNIAGANLTLAAGISTGTGLGGSLLFQTAPAGTSGATANTLATRMTVDSTGNIGIGALTPEQKLEVGGNILASASGNVSLILRSLSATSTDGQFTIMSASTSDRLDIRRGTGTLAETLMTIASSGHVGIGTVTPAALMHIASAGGSTGTLLRLQDSNSTCDFSADAGAPTCGSDLRLKKNVSSLDPALQSVLNLRPVLYNWKTELDDDPEHIGFIAQEVQQVFPELVTTSVWGDGQPALFLSMNGMIPYLVKSIQELSSASFTLNDFLEPPASDGPLARLVQSILAYIAEAFGIELSEGTVKTNRLCAGNACVNEEQLQRLLEVNMLSPATPTETPVESLPVPTSETPTPTPAPEAPTPTPDTSTPTLETTPSVEPTPVESP